MPVHCFAERYAEAAHWVQGRDAAALSDLAPADRRLKARLIFLSKVLGFHMPLNVYTKFPCVANVDLATLATIVVFGFWVAQLKNSC